MPYRTAKYVMPSRVSQIAASLISDDPGFFLRDLPGKARSNFLRNAASFCFLIRSGRRNLFFSGSVTFMRLSWCGDDVEIASYQGHAGRFGLRVA